MKAKLSRLLLASFSCLAVVSLLVLEIIASSQTKVENRSRKWVNHTYAVVESIETFGKLFRSFAEDAPTAESKKKVDDLQIQLLKIQPLVNDNPEQLQTLQDIHQKLIHPVSTENYVADIWASVATMKDRELRLLKFRREADESNAASSFRWIELSAYTTGILLLSLFALAAFDFRVRRRVEGELGETLNTMIKTNSDLAHLNKQKNEILRTTAHDLKNPLASIAGFAELIADESPENKSVLEMVAIVRRISQQTLDLVGGILEDSALQQGVRTFAKKKLNIIACIEEAVEILQSTAKLKSQLIIFDHDCKTTPLTVEGDLAKLRDAFLNLIGNALKFSPPSTAVHIGCRQQTKSVEISVTDQGPGINAADREKLFLPGQRLTAKPTGNESSTGLGLSIVKETVERHLGRIICKPHQEGKGSCFVVELPSTAES